MITWLRKLKWYQDIGIIIVIVGITGLAVALAKHNYQAVVYSAFLVVVGRQIFALKRKKNSNVKDGK